jgi:hypothetical protein
MGETDMPLKMDEELDYHGKQVLRDAHKIMDSQEYQNDNHPGHMDAIRSVRLLLMSIYGEAEEIQGELNRPLTGRERLYGVRK